jgi:hypothetical protein
MSLPSGIKDVVITTFLGPILLHEEEGILYRRQKRIKHNTAGNGIASNRPRTTTN